MSHDIQPLPDGPISKTKRKKQMHDLQDFGELLLELPPAEARRILRRLEFHYVPKHASWLNMVEIEIGVLRGQCLDRRIECKQRLVSEVAAWERQRNASRARVKWMFTTEKARVKMGRAYPRRSSVKES